MNPEALIIAAGFLPTPINQPVLDSICHGITVGDPDGACLSHRDRPPNKPPILPSLPINNAGRPGLNRLDTKYEILNTNYYAKQTQFPKYPNGCKRSYDKQL